MMIYKMKKKKAGHEIASECNLPMLPPPRMGGFTPRQDYSSIMPFIFGFFVGMMVLGLLRIIYVADNLPIETVVGICIGAGGAFVILAVIYGKKLAECRQHHEAMVLHRLEEQRYESERCLENGYQEAYEIICQLREQVETLKEEKEKLPEPVLATQSKWRSIDAEGQYGQPAR